jgi:hypothetical protein
MLARGSGVLIFAALLSFGSDIERERQDTVVAGSGATLSLDMEISDGAARTSTRLSMFPRAPAR